jgi:putative sporulation protein YyaC
MEYVFHRLNALAQSGVCLALDKLLNANLRELLNEKTSRAGTRSKAEKARFAAAYNKQPPAPIVVCIGSDLAIGDSLGPLVGSMLRYKTQGLGAYIYGTLGSPVTAKEIKYARTFLKQTHPYSQVIAIDAAVGEEGDIGMIKLTDKPLSPGAGAGKKLGTLGDISIMAIVAEKSLVSTSLFNGTRLNLVYSMAEIIAEGVSTLLWQRCKKNTESTLCV